MLLGYWDEALVMSMWMHWMLLDAHALQDTADLAFHDKYVL